MSHATECGSAARELSDRCTQLAVWFGIFAEGMEKGIEREELIRQHHELDASLIAGDLAFTRLTALLQKRPVASPRG